MIQDLHTVRFDSIEIGDSKTLVINRLGEPVKIQPFIGYEVYWYGSKVPNQAHFVYFEKENVVLVSENVQSSHKKLKDIYTTYGKSNIVFQKNSDHLQGEYRHVYPQDGFSIDTDGTQEISLIIRADFFAPIDLTTYTKTVGKNYQANIEAVTDKTEANTLTPLKQIQQQGVSYLQKNMIPVGIGILVGIVLCGIVVFIWYKKRKKQTETFITPPPVSSL